MTAPAPISDGTSCGRLQTDRPCIRCGHNLVNLEIVREPHYGLLIVRCPECGTAASMEEYPVLGAWARRLGTLVAAVVLLALVAAWAATSGATTGFSFMIAEEISRPFSQYLDEAHARDAEATGLAAVTFAGENAPAGKATLMFRDWLAQHDRAELLARYRTEGRPRLTLRLVLPALLIAAGEFAFGVVWTALLAGTPRRRLALFALPMIGLTALFVSVVYLGWFGPLPPYSWGAAQAIMGVRTLPFVLAGLGACFLAGLLAGRSIVRGVVRLLLAPRLRGALAILWTTDGLPPPR